MKLIPALLLPVALTAGAWELRLDGVDKCRAASLTDPVRLVCEETTTPPPEPPDPPPVPVECDGTLITRDNGAKTEETYRETGSVTNGQVYAYRFVANSGIGSITMGEFIDPLTYRLLSLSTKPCDFNWSGSDAIRVTYSTRPSITYSGLQRGKVYWASTTTRNVLGQGTCAKTCRFILTIKNP